MATLAVLVGLLLCGSLVLGGDPSYLQDERFLRWSETHLKAGSANLAEIYPTWRRNAEFVNRQNALGLSYTVSLNAFAHMVSVSMTTRSSEHAREYIIPQLVSMFQVLRNALE